MHAWHWGTFNVMPRLELFPFRYRDRVTGRWVKARYVAERLEIAARYTEWEIIGAPEVRDLDPSAHHFTPWQVMPHADLMRMESRRQRWSRTWLSRIDEREAFLTTLFLRRYVTYCARRKRYAQMQGAARLLCGVPKVSRGE